MKIITKIDEFVATKPTTSPSKPSPSVAPSKPKPSTPSPAPTKPSPIPTKKPSVEPVPKMKAGDVVKSFMETLKKEKGQVSINLSKLKKKYD
jgi:hypothetical protein